MRRTFVLGLALAGCVSLPPVAFTPTTAARFEPRPADCTFDVLSLPPSGPYRELGVVDSNTAFATTPVEFANAVRPTVCALGGDAVVAPRDRTGYYFHGTVLHLAPASNG